MTVRTRFAPSPTGYLHVGGVRTALYNWLFARQHGGQFVLRIDDTDQKRHVEEALQPILDGFRWLGIDWDEGPEVDGPHAPYFQSRRADLHRQAAQTLLDAGHAYRDYSGDDYRALREEAEKAKQPFVYDRRWMAENDEQAARFEAEGRQAVVRLKMPREGSCRFNDLVCGEMEFEWALETDHVIQRANGACLYHLASVADDRDFEITHVVRGIEHLSNTPRQIFIARGLGCEPPRFAHLPAIAEPGGSRKLSKRDIASYSNNREFKRLFDAGAAIAERIGLPFDADSFNPVLTRFYQEVGYLPEAINNYLLLLGWSLDDRTEEFSREQMIEHFSFERVNKAAASFDPQKLIAFQQRYMDRVPLKQKVKMVLPYLQRAGLVGDPPPCDVAPLLQSIIEAAGDRITVAGDILNFDDFFVADDELTYDTKAFQKRLVKKEEAGGLLRRFRERLADAELWDADSLDALLHDFVEQSNIEIGQIIHAVRVAVTGKAAGFGMFEILAILGKARCLRRIDRALAKLEAL